MGCKMTKILKKGEGSSEPYQKAPLPEPPPPDPPDARLPLTARQKFSINKSWKAISRALEPTGVVMFLKLFEENRDLLTLFGKLKSLKTRDEQAESLELAEHASIVMNSIDEGIRAMENVDFFFDLLHQIGASHRRLPGFKSEYFWKIERPFLEAVQLTLDERYSENIEKVYKITIRFIIETVIEGYENASEREVNDNVADTKSDSGSSCPMSGHQDVNVVITNMKTSAVSPQANKSNITLIDSKNVSGDPNSSEKTDLTNCQISDS